MDCLRITWTNAITNEVKEFRRVSTSIQGHSSIDNYFISDSKTINNLNLTENQYEQLCLKK